MIKKQWFNTEIGLFFSTLIVKLHGRNLKPIVDAVRLRSCDYVEEFDERYYDLPAHRDEPFIAGIEIVRAAARANGKGGAK